MTQGEFNASAIMWRNQLRNKERLHDEGVLVLAK